MLLDLLKKSSLFTLLHRIDLELAEETRSEGCPHCGGELHYARYRRKPRGGPDDLPDEVCICHSLCCDACRKRTLPPSVLFFGRRVYWGAVILLVVALRQNRDDSATLRKLQRRLGVARSTVWRWMEYFRESFPQTPRWKVRRGSIPPEVDRERVIGSLWSVFIENSSSPRAALCRLIGFVVPPDSARSLMDA